MDINQAFEDLLLAEEIAEQSGYEEGFKVGEKRLFEGYHLGYHRASVIGAQLGYYRGTLLFFQNSQSEKVAKNAENLLKKIDQFPKNNDENVNIKLAFENIKFQFNKFCTLAKINFSYPETDKLEF